MKRQRLTPRPDMLAHAKRLGFAFAEIAGEPYWDEAACYVFTSDEVDVLEAATAEIEARCM
jgi:glutathionylspermidine synthase